MAKTFKEFEVTVPNKVGSLAKVSGALGEGKVNILACCCYGMPGESNAHFHFVTDNPAKTGECFKKNDWTWKEAEVVGCELENKPGVLTSCCSKMAQAGVDIQYCYCSTGNSNKTWVFFCTNNNAAAAKVI